jgi:hypothetical protein
MGQPSAPPISEAAIASARHSDPLLDKVYPNLFTLSSYLRLILPIQRWKDIVRQLDDSPDELEKYLVATQGPPKRVGKEQLKDWAAGAFPRRHAALKEVSDISLPLSPQLPLNLCALPAHRFSSTTHLSSPCAKSSY